MHATTRRTLRALAAAAVTTALLAGCGDDDESGSADPTPSESTSSAPATTPEGSESASTEPTEPAEPAGPTLAIRVSGDKVTPNGELLSVAKGEPITLTFDSDRAGELHVHAKPEQYVEFEPGTSAKKLVIDTPGVVEIEEHDSGVVIAQLEVK